MIITLKDIKSVDHEIETCGIANMLNCGDFISINYSYDGVIKDIKIKIWRDIFEAYHQAKIAMDRKAEAKQQYSPPPSITVHKINNHLRVVEETSIDVNDIIGVKNDYIEDENYIDVFVGSSMSVCTGDDYEKIHIRESFADVVSLINEALRKPIIASGMAKDALNNDHMNPFRTYVRERGELRFTDIGDPTPIETPGIIADMNLKNLAFEVKQQKREIEKLTKLITSISMSVSAFNEATGIVKEVGNHQFCMVKKP